MLPHTRIFLCTVVLIAFPAACALAQTDAPVNPGFDISLLYNPAACGLDAETHDPFLVSEYGALRRTAHSLAVNYKDQLEGGFTGKSLRIISAAYQCRFFKQRMAAGLYFYTNTLNRNAMQDFQVMANYAYHWNIAEDFAGRPLHRLSFGLQAGYRNYGYNVNNIQTGAMYDPSYTHGFNPAMVNLEEFPDSKHLFDGNFGIQYTGLLGERWHVDAGVSFYHLFQPKTGLFEEDYRVPFRFNVFGGFQYSLPDGKPAGLGSELGVRLYYTYQATHASGNLSSVFYAGITYRYTIYDGLSLGAAVYYRTPCTIMPQITLDISRFTLSFQVEVNTVYSYNNLFSLGLSYRL